MVTTKKGPTKKSASTKAAAVRRTTKKIPKTELHHSFKRTIDSTPFFTYRFTIQSVYWLVLSLAVLGLGAWIMHLNVQIQQIYDRIEVSMIQNDAMVMPASQSSKTK